MFFERQMYYFIFLQLSENYMTWKTQDKRLFVQILFCYVTVIFSPMANAQPVVLKADVDAAKAFFNHRNFSSAIKMYQSLLDKEPDNEEYNRMIAKCYMLSNSVKAKAI